MTLLACVANQTHTVFAADRKLVGSSTDDEVNKVTVFVAADARTVVGFAGLATVGSPPTFRTHQWVTETLAEVAPPDCLIQPTIERFSAAATGIYSAIAAPRVSRVTGFAFAGYRYEVHGTELRLSFLHRVVHNGDITTEQFRAYDNTVRIGRQAYVAAYGSGLEAIDDSQVRDLLSLAEADKPATAILGKLIDTMYAVASSPKANGTVNKQCSAVILPSDLAAEPIVDYFSGWTTNHYYYPNFVAARCDGVAAVPFTDLNVEVGSSAAGPTAHLLVPKVPKNWPCPCGSGTKYRHCHARLQRQRASRR